MRGLSVVMLTTASAWSLAPLRVPTPIPLRSSARQTPARMQVDELAQAVIAAPQTFEAQGDPAQLAVLALVVGIPFGYWWYITVPEARLALSKDKRLGDTADYIRDLADSEEQRPVERWFFAKWLKKAPKKRPQAVDTAAPFMNSEREASETAVSLAEPPSEAPAERDVSLQELFEPASLAGNATPKFFSGDNPIVVTVGALMAAGIFAAVYRENASLAIDLLVLSIGLLFGATRLTLK